MGIFSFLFTDKKNTLDTPKQETDGILTSIERIPKESTTIEKQEINQLPNQSLTEEQELKLIDYFAKISIPDTSHQNVGDSLEDIDMGRLDPLLEDAARLVVIHQQSSTSLIQRKFSIGYNRAGRIMDQLEKLGVVKQNTNLVYQVTCIDESDLELRLNNVDANSRIKPFCSEDFIKYKDEIWISEFKSNHYRLISDRMEYYINLNKQIQEDELRAEIEAEKEKIKQEQSAKKRAKDIREAAMKELVEEGFIDSDYTKRREPIPQNVQDAVWNRDGGHCVKCGSQENLEFDHIIPFSKGGSNSIRNLQLLCKKCNLEKSNKIG